MKDVKMTVGNFIGAFAIGSTIFLLRPDGLEHGLLIKYSLFWAFLFAFTLPSWFYRINAIFLFSVWGSMSPSSRFGISSYFVPGSLEHGNAHDLFLVVTAISVFVLIGYLGNKWRMRRLAVKAENAAQAFASEFKICPHCAETVLLASKACKHCGRDI